MAGENLGEELGGGLAQAMRSLKEGPGRGQRESWPPRLGRGDQVRAGGQPRLTGYGEGDGESSAPPVRGVRTQEGGGGLLFRVTTGSRSTM